MRLQNKEYEKTMFDILAQYGNMRKSQEQIKFILDGLAYAHTTLKGRLLDCGCGVTNYGLELSKYFKDLEVTGIDISMESTETARFLGHNVICGDVEYRKQFSREEFDCILSMCFLHHFPDITWVMDNISFWLKPGGILIIMEPNARNLIKQASRIGRKVFEFLGGTNYMLTHGMTTPNETLHTIKTYLDNAEGFELLYKGGFPAKQRFRKEDVLLILGKV